MQELVLVLVGPDLQAFPHLKATTRGGAAVPVCRAARRQLRVHASPALYEDVHATLPAADLTMVFHPGLAADQAQTIETPGTLAGALRGTKRSAPGEGPRSMRSLRRAWLPCMRLFAESEAPLYFTAFSLTGALLCGVGAGDDCLTPGAL